MGLRYNFTFSDDNFSCILASCRLIWSFTFYSGLSSEENESRRRKEENVWGSMKLSVNFQTKQKLSPEQEWQSKTFKPFLLIYLFQTLCNSTFLNLHGHIPAVGALTYLDRDLTDHGSVINTKLYAYFSGTFKKEKVRIAWKRKTPERSGREDSWDFLFPPIVILMKYLVVWCVICCVRIWSSSISQLLKVFNPYTLQISLPKADEMRRSEKERVKNV